MEHWKVFWEKFFNSRPSRMAKTVILWPWWQLFNSFYFQTLSFFLYFLFFFLLRKKVGGWGGRGLRWPHGPPVLPALKLDNIFFWELHVFKIPTFSFSQFNFVFRKELQKASKNVLSKSFSSVTLSRYFAIWF